MAYLLLTVQVRVIYRLLVNAVDAAYKKGSPPTNVSGDPFLPIKR